jgi:multiple sugar transport system ATP-binding protein
MDEPLSNLDAKLRVQMRSEIIKLTERLGITTIYVTHDQVEAMTMASRIVVMKDGYIQQVGSPKEIYDYPDNIFVGGFIGTPPMNFLEGRVNDQGYFEIGDGPVVKIKVPEDKFAMLKELKYIRKPIVLGIRPENIYDDRADFNAYPEAVVKVKVDVAELLGAETIIYSDLLGQNLVSKVGARIDIHMGSDIELALDMNKAHFFDPETENRIKQD